MAAGGSGMEVRVLDRLNFSDGGGEIEGRGGSQGT
jgi:hypothetical protein